MHSLHTHAYHEQARHFITFFQGVTKDGQQRKFTFKVLNSMDSKKPGHIQVEHAVMQLLSENGINCSVPIKNVEGETFTLVTIPNEAKNADNNGN